MNREGIKNISEFNNHLQNYLKSEGLKDDNYILRNFWASSKTEDYVIIKNQDFSGLSLRNLDFTGFEFNNCKFDNCDYLSDITFRACILKNCSFKNSNLNDFKFLECDLIDIKFYRTVATYLLFADSLIKNTIFEGCFEVLELSFGGCEFENLKFIDTYLAHSQFEGYESINHNFKILFYKSFLSKNKFLSVNFSDSKFKVCSLNQNTFSNCKIGTETIENSNLTRENEFSFIDFQTILKSENINPKILEKCFGITDNIIKDKISLITKKSEYQTVFISYSFKDKVFAKKLDKSLNNKGVSTFLWEKDAPGGKSLNKIMKDNIKDKDRLLFIASKDSIKSKACHFELTQGRLKQEISWEETLYPIHIDHYIFELEKENIKPKEKQEEYWLNISELKEINSLDFTNWNEKQSDLDFEKRISELIKGLEK
jgi:uncharacterized protein YjbI with pentapeptide repeats